MLTRRFWRGIKICAKAKDQMDIVLKGDPDNLDYQLFRGELSVWMAKDLDVG